jgi:hypothetical protein
MVIYADRETISPHHASVVVLMVTAQLYGYGELVTLGS